MRAVVLSIAAAAMLLTALPASGQEAFSRVSVRTGGTYNVNRTLLNDYWEPGFGGDLAFSSPFYLGEAEAGFALHRYGAADPAVPRFDALLAYLGWGIEVSPLEVITWYGGLLIGNYRMAFDEQTFAGVRNESELTLGLASRVDVHLSDRAALYASARYGRTYTYPRLDTVYLSGGLSLRFESPDWLRTLLR